MSADADVAVRVIAGNDYVGDALVVVSAPLTPQSGTRRPIDLVCCVDVSGSMANMVSVQSADGAKESHGACHTNCTYLYTRRNTYSCLGLIPSTL